MSKSIVVTIPHALGKDEARRRIAAEIEQVKSAYVDKFAHAELNWTGDVADIRVVALAQEVTAHVDVTNDQVRVEVFLPWILASLANHIQSKLQATGQETLALTHQPKKP